MIYFVLAVLSVIVALFAVIILADVIPLAKRWYERIHIGQWESDEAFADKVNAVNSAWLKKTPSVRVSDNTRFTVIDRIKGNYKNSKLQSWQKAALLLGAEDKSAAEYLGSGTWKEDVDAASGSPDVALLAWAVLRRSEDKENVKPYMYKTAKQIFDSAEKFLTVPYNKSIPDMRFVDTVGMVCPFLFEYAKTYSDDKALVLAQKQFKEYLENGMNEKFFVPVHSFNKVNGAPSGIYGWGRGCGWFALGFMGGLESGVSEDLFIQAKKYADNLLSFQSSEGSWSRQLFSETAGESSATAMIACFMAEMYKKSKDERYLESAKKAKSFIKSVTRVNGKVDMAQGDTKGIGFYSSVLDTMPASQGFTAFLMNFLSDLSE